MTQAIVQIMVDNQIISANERDIYIYCLDFIFEYVSFICISLLIGMFFGLTITVLIFLFTFLSLRLYGGGYHAETRRKCIIYSYTVVFLACVILIIGIQKWNDIWNYCINILYILSYLLYIILAPVDNPNKRLDKIQRRKYNIRSIIICHIIAILYAVLLLNKQYTLYTSVSFGSFISAFSLLIGRKHHGA